MAEDLNLMALIRALVANDTSAAKTLLKKSPATARLAIKGGATREDAQTYFIDELRHYIYAGDTALHVAAIANRHEIIPTLIDCGACVCAANRRGAQPIHYAADGSPTFNGSNSLAQYKTIKALVSAGANPNSLDKSGVAPIHRAVRNRCTEAVRALIDCGADFKLKNKSGSTPLHLAVQTTGKSGSGAEECKNEQLAIVELLLASGAKLKDKDASGKTAGEAIQSIWLRQSLEGHIA